MPVARAEPPDSRGSIDRFFSDLGPGLITGCADDDPSGISTYSYTGAAFGYSLLWTALLSFPLMVALQTMCGRLGLVAGRGLAGVLRKHYPRWVLWGACILLVIANICNIAADLGGMGDTAAMISGVPSMVWTPLFAMAIVAFLFWSSYRRIAQIFKWITLVLLAYVVTAFFVRVDWRTALLDTVRPQLTYSREYWAALVGILGTTISPYLFFWQASQEVEEQRAQGKPVPQQRDLSAKDLRRLRIDVNAGMFASNFIMYFVILTSATTLHAHGVFHVDTARQAAEALRPLAGEFAYLLFALGLVGTGMLGVPVLAGSCAYAISEAAAWRGSLERKPSRATNFYAVIAAAVLIGVALNFFRFNAVRMLFWSAVLNGILAPPLILLILLATSNPEIRGDSVNSPAARVLGWITFAIMTAAAVAFLAG